MFEISKQDCNERFLERFRSLDKTSLTNWSNKWFSLTWCSLLIQCRPYSHLDVDTKPVHLSCFLEQGDSNLISRCLCSALLTSAEEWKTVCLKSLLVENSQLCLERRQHRAGGGRGVFIYYLMALQTPFGTVIMPQLGSSHKQVDGINFRSTTCTPVPRTAHRQTLKDRQQGPQSPGNWKMKL